jgi:phosphoglycerate dehydrogenase-like enzyme
MTDPLNVLVSFAPIMNVVDTEDFARRFPGVHLSVAAYDIPHEELVDRTERPHEVPAEEDLSPELRAAFGSADIMVTLNVPLNVAQVAPRLRWVQAIGSGIGQFMASGVEGRVYTNAAGTASPPIAEWVVAQVFSIYKRLPEHWALQREHRWESTLGSVITGRRAAIIGLGAIGTEVAARLGPVGLHVTGVRRRPAGDEPLPVGVSELQPPSRLHEIVADSDVVVACVPGIPANADMFDADFFAAMRKGSVFINVGRGSSVDEAALIDALTSGHLRGAAIDVAKREPLPADDPLWDAPNLSISPHSSASMEGYMERVWALFCDNLERYLADRPLRNLVDMQAEYGLPA